MVLVIKKPVLDLPEDTYVNDDLQLESHITIKENCPKPPKITFHYE